MNAPEELAGIINADVDKFGTIICRASIKAE